MISSLIAIAAVLIMGVMSPGPSFIYVARTAVVQSRVHGLMTALGTLTGHGLLVLLIGLLGYPVAIGRAFSDTVSVAALLNFVLTPFSFGFLVWFHRRALPGGSFSA